MITYLLRIENGPVDWKQFVVIISQEDTWVSSAYAFHVIGLGVIGVTNVKCLITSDISLTACMLIAVTLWSRYARHIICHKKNICKTLSHTNQVFYRMFLKYMSFNLCKYIFRENKHVQMKTAKQITLTLTYTCLINISHRTMHDEHVNKHNVQSSQEKFEFIPYTKV